MDLGVRDAESRLGPTLERVVGIRFPTFSFHKSGSSRIFGSGRILSFEVGSIILRRAEPSS
jgi:hypothetical protein